MVSKSAEVKHIEIQKRFSGNMKVEGEDGLPEV